MKNDVSREDQPKRLYVNGWMKAFMYGVTLLPILLMPWVWLNQLGKSDRDMTTVAVICIAVMVAFVWLFLRLYSLCSVELDSEGVAQSFAWLRNGFGRRAHLRWEQVQRVSFVRASYYFVGDDGLKLELNTTLFGNANAAIGAVRMLLPHRLLLQLDSNGR
jgi:Bacterial PH domain